MVVARRLAEVVRTANTVIGVAQYPADGSSVDELLQVAQERAQAGQAAA